MCGIAGIVGRPGGVSTQDIGAMTRAVAHRGPDDEGIWLDREAGVAFGHRRLAIIDVSAAGHQPMHSHGGRYVITFNGEIYNYEDLRKDLAAAGHQVEWRGHSDHEVLLAGFEFWGIKPTLERATGMFAFGLWDRQERSLILARDRLGEKPLYYGRANGPSSVFLFGSELKALRQHPDFAAEVDREALGQFVRYLDVPAPRSIYRGISKLPPGAILTLRHGKADPDVELYWSGLEVARSGVANPLDLDPDAATDLLERTLERAVERQMVADVPLGAFLSGGVDSSTVVAMMQKVSSRPVKTFTIGFNEAAYNEAEHAKAVALHLGTDHTELYVTGAQAMDVIPSLPTMYDEPFADSSQIPTHLVSALARQKVTVSLSGDGGDELFGGYERYRLTAGLWRKMAAVPMPLRLGASQILSRVPAPAWTTFAGVAQALVPRRAKVAQLGNKMHKGVRMLSSSSLEHVYEHLLTQWPDPAQIVVGVGREENRDHDFAGLSGVEWMMARDMLGYLSDDILAKVDRAAMAVSLETRVPLLDPEVVELAWRLPLDLKIRAGTTKWVLRQVLYRHVPRSLIERPKMGFGVPLGDWLRGPLRTWAEELIDERTLAAEGYFHPAAVRGAWAALLKGDPQQELRIWTILMFQSWLQAQQDPARASEARRAVLAG